MTHEVETKILEVDPAGIASTLERLGAEKTQQTRLKVTWYRPVGTKEDEVFWFLRVRTYSDGKTEVTWKGKSEVLGVARRHKEINFTVSDPAQIIDLFEQLGLEQRAYQEKDRISWEYQDWKFDLDQYPGIPSYLEIEGHDEAHIQEAIKLLKLENHESSSEGERLLILNKYQANWYDMRF